MDSSEMSYPPSAVWTAVNNEAFEMKCLSSLYLMLGFILTSSQGNGQDTAAVLTEAREHGRVASRFLKDATAASMPDSVVPEANVEVFHRSIGPTLIRSCLACHGPDKSEGRLRIDQLNPDLLNGPDAEKWQEVFDAISKSEMPPDDASDSALADDERRRIVDWLSEELNAASRVRRSSMEHSSFRRMTNYEYNYALQDLLGLTYSLPNKLPTETVSNEGFRNSSDLLQMSAMQFEICREFGLNALRRVTVVGDRPQPVEYVVSMKEEFEKASSAKDARTFEPGSEKERQFRNQPHLLNRDSAHGVVFAGAKTLPRTDPGSAETARKDNDASPSVVLALPASRELKLDLDRFLPDDGVMRVRIRAGRSTMNPNEFASLRLIFSAHTSNDANFSQVISEQDVPVTASAAEPQVIEFDIPLSDIQRNPFRKLETTFPRRDEFLHIQNVSNAHGGEQPLQVLIESIEITAPFYESWPPKTHTDIFFASDHRANEDVYGREVLGRFLTRVWRRPVGKEDIDPFMELFARYRPGFSTFEETMIEVLATTLATPEFLYLTQRTTAGDSGSSERISDLEFASRLAMFLWSSVPDEELLTLAEQGTLREPEVLAAQIDRMLADARSSRLSKHFVEQWLVLDRMDSVTHLTDATLKDAMLEEPVAFFDHVRRRNLSVVDFIHSDYVVINERLASHYHVPEVFGPQFRAVPISPELNRGGILTCAAIMAINSDGKDSHPLKRGVWMLKRILDDPPPPPPPNVPTVDLTDPEILKMTLKERIVNHRNKPACLSCHSRIDPWGIAFENYDALGAYRTQIGGQPVDAAAELFNGQPLTGIDGLKEYLLADRQDQFVRAMVQKLTSYALGRPMSFGDSAEIDSLTASIRQKGDGLDDLIHLIVQSDLFNSR
ncbi:MAG: DUF1592 domain-containing protein [Planctomycetaceae bacterium]